MPPDTPPDVPAAWAGAIAAILARRDATVLVVGGVDVGKSVFLRLLAEAAGRAGRTAAMLDADLGQKDFGPPGCVSLRMLPPPALPDAAEDHYFVGATNPMGHFLPLVTGTARMAVVARRRGAEITGVNTSGLVRAGGPLLKARKADAVAADMAVAIARGDELRAVLAALRPLPVLRLAPSPLARRKTEAERRRRRQENLLRQFARAGDVELALPRLVLLGDGLSGGAEDRGRICGLVGEDGRGLGLGAVVDFREGRLRLRTAVAADAVAAVRLGDPKFVLPRGEV